MSEALPVDPCEQCGHDTNDHRLYGYGDAPVEGWMSCPVAGCACHATWSREGGSAEGAKAAYERFLAEQRARGSPS